MGIHFLPTPKQNSISPKSNPIPTHYNPNSHLVYSITYLGIMIGNFRNPNPNPNPIS